MRLFTALCVLVVITTFLNNVDGAGGGGGGGKKKKSLQTGRTRKPKVGKPQADAPLPSRNDDEFEDYDATYYDEDYDGAANEGSNLGSQPNANDNGVGEETTEVYRQPDDELPTGKSELSVFFFNL